VTEACSPPRGQDQCIHVSLPLDVKLG
jgi:hypothetical protein